MAHTNTPIPEHPLKEQGLCDETAWSQALHQLAPSDHSLVTASLSVGASDEALGQHAGPSRAPAGPGWFESSWMLRRGLEVRELGSLSLQDSLFET